MPITIATLTTGADSVGHASTLTASVSPTGDVATIDVRSNLAGLPTVSASGVAGTWTVEATVTSGNIRLTRLRGKGPFTPGRITLSASAGSPSWRWTVSDIAGVITTGTNASDAFVQSPTGTAAAPSLSITLAAFANATYNAGFAFFGLGTGSASTWTPRAAWTELADDAAALETQWIIGQDSAASATSSAGTSTLGIASELAANVAFRDMAATLTTTSSLTGTLDIIAVIKANAYAGTNLAPRQGVTLTAGRTAATIAEDVAHAVLDPSRTEVTLQEHRTGVTLVPGWTRAEIH